MPKNIVVCCDGTSNEYGDRNTNVVKLYSILSRDTPGQIAFYDPGVGTLTAPAAITKPIRVVKWISGLAFGTGIMRNIREAYRYLMQTYEPGDSIFLFGFSRGAYTVRALAAMIHKCGLLMPHNESLIPYAMKMFRYGDSKSMSNGFRTTFARHIEIHFVGVWDTVSSVGWIYDPVKLPYTQANESVRVFRHAIAIDERRCFFRQNQWTKLSTQDCKELWFPGTHCDVGGSYDENRSGLSQLALRWMVDEAVAHGLRVDRQRVARVLPQDPSGPGFPDANAPVNESLLGLWWIAEILPRLRWDRHGSRRRLLEIPIGGHRWLEIPLGRHRYMPSGAVLHRACRDRKDYSPINLPIDHVVDDAAPVETNHTAH